MYQQEITIQNESGLHARPANLFIKETLKFKSVVKVFKDGNEFNGKSILSILSMAASKGDVLTVQAEGEDEKETVEALVALANNKFGE